MFGAVAIYGLATLAFDLSHWFPLSGLLSMSERTRDRKGLLDELRENLRNYVTATNKQKHRASARCFCHYVRQDSLLLGNVERH